MNSKIMEQEPGPILLKFASSSIILQCHELHCFRLWQNSPSWLEFPSLQSQRDRAGEKKISSSWSWIDLQAVVQRKQERQRRQSTKEACSSWGFLSCLAGLVHGVGYACAPQN